MANTVTSYFAECFWPGVGEEDLSELDRRIAASLVAIASEGERIRYLGWLLVVDDEVVLVLFTGPIGMVRRVAEHAGIPFGRILQAAHTPWLASPPINEEVMECE